MSALRFAPPEARCAVYVRREGVLSRVGHDLRLAVARFEVVRDGAKVTGRFELGSIETVCAVRDGRDDFSALSRGDLAKIDENLHREVLHTNRFNEASFEGELTPSEEEINGTLSLCGVHRRVTATVKTERDEKIVMVRLSQRDFGITPFTAMLGALKVQSEVTVVLRVTE